MDILKNKIENKIKYLKDIKDDKLKLLDESIF